MYTCCTVHSQHAYFTQRVILQLIMYVHSDSWWKLVCQNDIVTCQHGQIVTQQMDTIVSQKLD